MKKIPDLAISAEKVAAILAKARQFDVKDVYGFAPLPPKRGIWAGIPRSPRTPVPGVYLASSFAGSGGFTGAMSSGSDAARHADAED